MLPDVLLFDSQSDGSNCIIQITISAKDITVQLKRNSYLHFQWIKWAIALIESLHIPLNVYVSYNNLE